MTIRTAHHPSHIKESAGDRFFQAVILFFSVLLMLIVAYPLYFTVIASFSKPEDVLLGRVIFWPKNISFESYQMVIAERSIWMGYGNTILYTVLGTLINLALTIMIAYPLSCRETPCRGILTFVASFTMLFSGGLIPTYLLVRQLGMYNTIWAMLLPSGITTYNMLVMKNFFQSSIPGELKEAACLDGCTDLQTLLLVVLPLSGSIIAVMECFSRFEPMKCPLFVTCWIVRNVVLIPASLSALFCLFISDRSMLSAFFRVIPSSSLMIPCSS